MDTRAHATVVPDLRRLPLRAEAATHEHTDVIASLITASTCTST